MLGNNNSNNHGFTLLEILLAVSLFSLLSIIAVDLYLLALSAQRQTAFRQKILSNVRYVTEVIDKQIRESEIYFTSDYVRDGDQGINGAEDELALIDQNGNTFEYFICRQAGADCAAEQIGDMVVSINGTSAVSLTKASELEVINFNFYISPAIDPFFDERCNRNFDSGQTFFSCQSAAVQCTICPGKPDDCSEEVPATGYCVCRSNSDCLTGNCDDDAYEGDGIGLCLPVNQQPRVTIAIGFKSNGVKTEDQKIIFLQTTVSSRIYKR